MTFKKFVQWYAFVFFLSHVWSDVERYLFQEPLYPRSAYLEALVISLLGMWYTWYEDRKKAADSGGKRTQDPSQG
jgi:hypothetical protein